MPKHLNDYYLTPIKLFQGEKEPLNQITYKRFVVERFRGLQKHSISFTRNDLVLLLGLNESGKTSILKALETFDYNNDPIDPNSLKPFFTSIRNKQDLECSTPSVITADVEFSAPLKASFFRKAIRDGKFDQSATAEAAAVIEQINLEGEARVSRVVPFSNGNPGKSFYKFEGLNAISDQRLEAVLAQEVVRRCPFIIYFEDFQDSIPPRIYTSKKSNAFNSVWYEILDGLFYNTDKKYSISSFLKYYAASNRREDDARTVLKKVNKKLKQAFTEKWQNLSGVREIEETELIFQEKGRFFEIKITEKDGTTYSVHERSKGAVWYLAFLMKTEFRRKKLREGSGKPVYLIDEPASNLHSTAQQKMVEDFTQLVEDTTLIYTTHSRYLVSPSNVRNTFVVQRSSGQVECTKWGDFIQGKEAETTYYQPLYDCLDIVPTNFDMPWQKAVVTEGPSDALVLRLMHAVLELPIEYAIYPGTSASNLSTLISLNMGWNADFRVLLDSDPEGLKQKTYYMDKLELDESKFVMLPSNHSKIENMFSASDRSKMLAIATSDAPKDTPTKKEFLTSVRVLTASVEFYKGELRESLEKETLERFKILLLSLAGSPR